MTDIFFAIGVVLAVSLISGVGLAISKKPAGDMRVALMTVLLFGAFGSLFYTTGKIFWAKYIPHSAVIVWSNFVPLLTALVAGLAYRLPKTPHWRQLLSSGLLALLSFGSVFWPVIGFIIRPTQPGGNTWHQGVAIQTSRCSCSPAAAATLLNANGIRVNESDLMVSCLTDSRGTVSLGLYRGIKQHADENNMDVEIVPSSLDELYAQDDWPVLLMVELPRTGVQDPRYEQDWGWIPGLGHSVVALKPMPGGDMIVGDPSIGLERWTRRDLDVLWHGDGIRIKNPAKQRAPRLR